MKKQSQTDPTDNVHEWNTFDDVTCDLRRERIERSSLKVFANSKENKIRGMFFASCNLSVDGIASNFKHNFSKQIDSIINLSVVKARREKRKNLISDGTKQQYSNHSANGNSNPETSCKWNRSQRMKENTSGANFVGQSYRNLQKLSKERKKEWITSASSSWDVLWFFFFFDRVIKKIIRLDRDWKTARQAIRAKGSAKSRAINCGNKFWLQIEIWFRVVVLVNSLNAENVCSAITQFSDGYL